MNLMLITNFIAGTAIPANRIVKPGATDKHVVLATAATDAMLGVSDNLSVAVNERIDVERIGISTVEAGAAITRGAFVTADATGRAITAAPAAGTSVNVIGFADETAGAAGDFIRVLLSPGQVRA